MWLAKISPVVPSQSRQLLALLWLGRLRSSGSEHSSAKLAPGDTDAAAGAFVSQDEAFVASRARRQVDSGAGGRVAGRLEHHWTNLNFHLPWVDA